MAGSSSSSSSLQSARVSRQVLVASRCDLPMNDCNGLCVEVTCVKLASVVAAHGPVTPGPPTLNFAFIQASVSSSNNSSGGSSVTSGHRSLLGPKYLQHPTTNHQLSEPSFLNSPNPRSSMQLQWGHEHLYSRLRQLLQASGDINGDVQQYVTYGLAPNMSLAPCSQGYGTCGVEASDYLYNDLSAHIDVQDVTPGCNSSDSGSCIFCSPLLLEYKLCLPGDYTFRYYLSRWQ